MTRREKGAQPTPVVLVASLALALGILHCNPRPTPSPTPSPTPAPTTTPSPVACEVPATSEWDVQPGESRYTDEVNTAMAALTGCEIKSDCKVSLGPDEWFAAVTAKLREAGLCAGIARPGEDQIIVASYRCGWYNAAHVFNYGGAKVAWLPGSYTDDWHPGGGVCP